jgi:hypothetical protein
MEYEKGGNGAHPGQVDALRWKDYAEDQPFAEVQITVPDVPAPGA